MGGVYGTPCSGELQFWARVPAAIRELTAQVKRVADVLEARNTEEKPVFVKNELIPELSSQEGAQ